MAQPEINLRDLYRVLRKRKLMIILAPILMGLATFTFTEPPPPVYNAEALVKVSRNSTLAGLVVEVVSFGSYDNMATQIVVVTSRPVLEKVAYRLHLIKRAEELDAALDGLRAHISAEQRSNSDILAIKASASSPEEAIALANTTADAYVEQSTAERDARINEKVMFIRRRLADSNEELRKAGRELIDFKQANISSLNVTVTQGVEIQEKHFQYQQKVADARAALASLVNTQETKEYDALEQLSFQVDDPGVRALTEDVSKRAAVVTDLAHKRVDLLRYQTQASPQVVTLTAQLVSAERRLETYVTRLIQRLTSVVAEYERMESTLARQQSEQVRHPDTLRQIETLQSVVKEKQELTSILRKQLQDAELQQKEKLEDLTLVERAHSVAKLVQASRYYKTLIGALIGILLGGVFAFVLESMDTSIGTIEDVENYLQTEVLGVVPHLEVEDVKSRMSLDKFSTSITEEEIRNFARLCTHFDPKSVASEAYRTMRTHVQSVMAKSGARIVLITSSALREGKTTSATNLATALAQAGQRTLLIDADLRIPTVHKILGLGREPGLSDILLGTHNFKDCCRGIEDLMTGKYGLNGAQATPGLEFLYFLSAGRSVDNASELLSADAVEKLFAEVRQSFDITIVDSSPVLPVADASILAPKVDGVILAYQIGRIGRDVLRRSKLRLDTLGAHVLGIIMNDIQAEIDYTHRDYSYYRYAYEGYPSRAKTKGKFVRNIFS